MFKHPTHLITPSEILSTSSEGSHSTQGMNVGGAKIHNVVVNDPKSIEVEVKVVGETRIPVISKSDELECQRESHVIVAEKKEKSFCSQASDLSIQMTRDCCVETYTIEGARQASDANVTTAIDQSPNTADEDVQDSTRDVSTKIGESAAPMIVPQSSIPSKGKKYKGKNSQVSGPSSPSPSPFNSTDSSNEPSSSSCPPSMDAAFSQLFAMPEMLDQLDNNYYRNILDNEGLLIVDHQLATDKRTKPYVKKMTKGQDYFFKEFARAITILSENNPLTGTKGEIRKQCNVVNKHH